MRNHYKQPILVLVVSAVLVLTGCASRPTNQDIDAVVGGVYCDMGETQIGKGRGRAGTIIADTYVGAVIGRSIRRTMDDAERVKVTTAHKHLPSNRSITQQNPDSGTFTQ